MYVKSQQQANEEDMQRYFINNIDVFPNYDPEQALAAIHHDTVAYNNKFYIDGAGSIEPEVLAEAIFINKGMLYSRKDYDYTLSRLADLAVFKFISVRFEERP